MTSLAGLHEQLDDLHSHWRQVQERARSSPGRHQPLSSIETKPGHDAYAAEQITDRGQQRAAAGSKAQSLPSSYVQQSRQQSSSVRSAAKQHQLPQCIITPANAGHRRPPQQLPQNLARLQQVQAQASHAPPESPVAFASLRPRLLHADNAENDCLGHLHSPANLPFCGKTAQKHRKQKRPQWQDVSIDLTAIQAAQEQSASAINHAERPVGPLHSSDTAGVAHMSGVSPASPSPPKQHRPSSSVPTLPALTTQTDSPHEALAAWHENLVPDQQLHRTSQKLGTTRPSLRSSGPLHASLQRQPRQAQLPTCLPPLRHQVAVDLSTPHLQTPSGPSLAQSEALLQQPRPYHNQGVQMFPESSSRYAMQASADLLPSNSHHTAEVGGYAPNSFRQPAEDGGSHVLCRSSHQPVSEDPRSAQQVPVQYMRHPFGSGSPGGLHRLHRSLKPIARSQHQPGNSSSQASAACPGPLTQRGHEHAQQECALVAQPESLLHLWEMEPWQHAQSRASVEQQGRPPMVHQWPSFDAPAVLDSHWQHDDITQQQQQQQSWQQQRQWHQPLQPPPQQHQQQDSRQQWQQQHQKQQQSDMPASIECDNRDSKEADDVADIQDVNMRLQQVFIFPTYRFGIHVLVYVLNLVAKLPVMLHAIASLELAATVLSSTWDMQVILPKVPAMNSLLLQVRSCLRNGRQEDLQACTAAELTAVPSGPGVARGKRTVGDGGFAGMRLSQVLPARPPIGPRRRSETHTHAPELEAHPKEGRRVSTGSSRQQEGLDAWQGQGLDQVLRPVPHLRPPHPSRQHAQALQSPSGAVRNTYAGYIQELQQSGADTGSRLALHAGRRNTGSEAVEALLRHPGPPSSAPQPGAKRPAQAPSGSIMSLLRRVTYTAKASQLRPTNAHSSQQGGDAQTECSICLEIFALQEQLRRVGCGHLFHPRCIQEWFATGDTRCPMCRFDPVTKRWPG